MSTENSICYNCKSHTGNKFCSVCGQKAKINLDPTIKDFVHDLVHEFLHLDGKIFLTLKTLLFYPGRLTLDYLKGVRAPYIHPIRLFLTLSAVYFLVSFLQKHNDGIEKSNVNVVVSDADLKAQQVQVNLGLGNQIDKVSEQYARQMIKGLGEVSKNKSNFSKNFKSVFSKELFVLLPLFAFLLKISFGWKSRRYLNYLYFSLHFHSFCFALLTLSLFLDPIFNTFFLLVLIVFYYLIKSLSVVFDSNFKSSVKRSVIVIGVYSIFLIGALAIAGLKVLYDFGGGHV